MLDICRRETDYSFSNINIFIYTHVFTLSECGNYMCAIIFKAVIERYFFLNTGSLRLHPYCFL